MEQERYNIKAVLQSQQGSWTTWEGVVNWNIMLENMGPHQLELLVDMLTISECENLLAILSNPEEDIIQRINKLSAENNPLGLSSRGKRDISSAVGASASTTTNPPTSQHRTKRTASSVDTDPEVECRVTLTEWLLRYGEQIYFDRLSRALHHIGRTDIAFEVGKNINQDKIQALKRYVEDYHRFVSSREIPKAKEEKKEHQHGKLKMFKREVRDLSWRDLDLIIMWTPNTEYQKDPLDLFLPLLYGLLVGFGSSLVVAVSFICFISYLSNRNQRISQSTSTPIWIHNTQNELIQLEAGYVRGRLWV
ncbi:transmembrane and death domain protein 1-like [Thalassophryne amazonica]|uniref:transmembrane and death domain protein 1-like n=1 Tax=Thalassophryne amazonica TaxID=390379 RepID=UPI001471F254|nr:transmembrane and death domain protein 1-like [Thalassophryne amazonica]